MVNSFTGGSGGTLANTRRRGTSTAARVNPIAKGNSAGGWGDAMRQSNVIVPGLVAGGYRVTGPTIGAADRSWLAATSPSANRSSLGGLPNYGARAGGGGYGGGGGGGGAAAVADPTMTQGMFDWITGLINSGAPQQVTASVLDLPDYTATFDPTMYNELETNFGTAVGQDRESANAAYANLENYLNTNYTNAFNNPNNTYATAGQAPGATPAEMARLAEGQGVDPAVMAQQTEGAAAADAGFANLWKVLAANEDTAQRNRLTRVQTDRGTTGRAIDAAALQGRTGIGMQRNQARSAFEQRAAEIRNQIAQQEAMANWTRQNQVTDINAQGQNEFRNQQIAAMLGLLPNIIEAGGNITLPGQAPQRPVFTTTAQDPHGWASIAAAAEWDKQHGGG